MKFLKGLAVILCVAITSMFYFPFEFRALPGMNTKKAMAAMALVILFFRMIGNKKLSVSRDFILLSLLAGLVSFAGIVSVTLNNTTDYTYATYIMSFWVWWGAAFTVCSVIRWIHGQLNWRLIAAYLTAVCVFQCIITLAMDSNPLVKQAINSVVLQQDMVFMGNVHRLYGIGCALDVAGMRFAAVLAIIMYLLTDSRVTKQWYESLLYILAFLIITVVGNMIARTTLVGVGVALLYLLYVSVRPSSSSQAKKNKVSAVWYWLVGIAVVSIPYFVYSYNNDPRMHSHLRFAFEGFFNLVEKGDFNYTSNDRLREMYVWPDNAKTWIIGDGYFENPLETDVHYTGETTEGYYMSTDVGYVRFIFYFGVVGMLLFSYLMLKVAQACAHQSDDMLWLFAMLLALNFIVWFKVSSDLFLVFAPFLCLGYNDNVNLDENENEDCLLDSCHM
jgi:hypothetical protein